jgi:hypothetical protein
VHRGEGVGHADEDDGGGEGCVALAHVREVREARGEEDHEDRHLEEQLDVEDQQHQHSSDRAEGDLKGKRKR